MTVRPVWKFSALQRKGSCVQRISFSSVISSSAACIYVCPFHLMENCWLYPRFVRRNGVTVCSAPCNRIVAGHRFDLTSTYFVATLVRLLTAIVCKEDNGRPPHSLHPRVNKSQRTWLRAAAYPTHRLVFLASLRWFWSAIWCLYVCWHNRITIFFIAGQVFNVRHICHLMPNTS